MPPRASLGPGPFNHKESENLKVSLPSPQVVQAKLIGQKRVAELEKELAELRATENEMSGNQQKEKADLVERSACMSCMTSSYS